MTAVTMAVNTANCISVNTPTEEREGEIGVGVSVEVGSPGTVLKDEEVKINKIYM